MPRPRAWQNWMRLGLDAGLTMCIMHHMRGSISPTKTDGGSGGKEMAHAAQCVKPDECALHGAPVSMGTPSIIGGL